MHGPRFILYTIKTKIKAPSHLHKLSQVSYCKRDTFCDVSFFKWATHRCLYVQFHSLHINVHTWYDNYGVEWQIICILQDSGFNPFGECTNFRRQNLILTRCLKSIPALTEWTIYNDLRPITYLYWNEAKKANWANYDDFKFNKKPSFSRFI